MLVGRKRQEMKRTHSGLTLHGVGRIGSTEHEPLSTPCKKTGHYWVHLIVSFFFIVSFTQMHQINSAAISFVTKMAKIMDGKLLRVSQFRQFSNLDPLDEAKVKWRTWCCLKGSSVVEMPIRMTEDQESALPTSTSLSTVQTWLLHTWHRDITYMARPTTTNTLPWGGNGQVTWKKDTTTKTPPPHSGCFYT